MVRGFLQSWEMIVVKISFMLIAIAGDIGFFRAGSLSRNHLKGKNIIRL